MNSDIVDIDKGDGGGFEEGEGERKRREAATRDAILKMRRKRSDLRCSMQPDKISYLKSSEVAWLSQIRFARKSSGQCSLTPMSSCSL